MALLFGDDLLTIWRDRTLSGGFDATNPAAISPT